MTVEELINELMASCQCLDDEVILCDVGGVTKVSSEEGTTTVLLNDYARDEDRP